MSSTSAPPVALVFPPYVYSLARPYMGPAQLAAYLSAHGIPCAIHDLNLHYCLWLSREGGELDSFETSLAGDYRAAQGSGDLRLAGRIARLLPSLRRSNLQRGLGELMVSASAPDPWVAETGVPRRSYAALAEDLGVVRAPDARALLETAARRAGIDPFGRWLESGQGIERLERIARAATVAVSLAFWQQLHPALILARAVKRRSPGTRVVFGGPQITLLAEDDQRALAESPDVDGLVRWDGEVPLLALAAGSALTEVPSLLFRGEDGAIEHTAPAPPIDLDLLPPPEYEAADLPFYARDTPIALGVLVTRGCYWGKCKFCDYPYVSAPGERRYRRRSPARVVEDVKALQRRHHVAHFDLTTESLPPDWAEEFSARILAERIAGSFTAFMRPEGASVLTPGRMGLMRAAGFEWLAFGAEVPSDRLLEAMDKGTSAAKIHESLYAAELAGIRPMTGWIPDFPSITEGESADLLTFLRAHRDVLAGMQVHAFDLTPAGPLKSHAETFGLEVGGLVPGSRALQSHEIGRASGLAGGALDAARAQVNELAGELRLYQATVRNRERIAAAAFDWDGAGFVFAKTVAVRACAGAALWILPRGMGEPLELPVRLEAVARLIASRAGELVPFAGLAACLGGDRAAAIALLQRCVESGVVTRVFGGPCLRG